MMTTRTSSSMDQTWNLGEHELNPEQRNDYLRAQLQAFSLGEDEIRLGVVQAALRGCGFSDMNTVAEVFKQSSRLPIPGKTVKIDDFVEAFSQYATPLGPNDDTMSSTLGNAPWERKGDHQEHIGFVQLQSYLQSTAADSAIPKRPESVQKATVKTPRKMSHTPQEKIISQNLENEMTLLKSKLALAVANQDFVRAADIKKEIDANKARIDAHETTSRQFPFVSSLSATERTAIENEAVGVVRIELMDATLLVLSHFRDAMLRSDRGGHHAIAKMRQTFKDMDTDASGSIDPSELRSGLESFGIEMSTHDLSLLFAAVDTDGSGAITIDEFLSALRGEISIHRRRLIHEAFKKLDRNGDGELRIEDLKKIFGEGKAAKLDYLLNNFDDDGDGTVSESEFLLYYTDLSAAIRNDDAFEVMIRSAFHLSGGKDGVTSTTNMRVLCIFDNGDKKFVTIEDDLGLDKTDHEELLRRVAAQGIQGVVRVDAFGTQ